MRSRCNLMITLKEMRHVSMSPSAESAPAYLPAVMRRHEFRAFSPCLPSPSPLLDEIVSMIEIVMPASAFSFDSSLFEKSAELLRPARVKLSSLTNTGTILHLKSEGIEFSPFLCSHSCRLDAMLTAANVDIHRRAIEHRHGLTRCEAFADDCPRYDGPAVGHALALGNKIEAANHLLDTLAADAKMSADLLIVQAAEIQLPDMLIFSVGMNIFLLAGGSLRTPAAALRSIVHLHAHAALSGCPAKSFGVTAPPVRALMRFIKFQDGWRRPVSMLLIIHREISSFTPNSSCERLLVFRQAASACSFAISVGCHVANSKSRGSANKVGMMANYSCHKTN